MASQELYEILKSKRENLADFLKNNNSYNYLRTLLSEIEVDYEANEIHQNGQMSIIKKLFLGNIGLESNKQKAIYELPTDELLTIIKFICEFNNIKYIEEIASGQGLLSRMLKNKLSDEYTINATDGNKWVETINTKRYYEVSNKLVLKYCLENDFSFDDKLVIISWFPVQDVNDFKKLITIKKPKNIILIGDIDKNELLFEGNNYNLVQIPIKQLCYLDYFNKNEYLNERLSKSSLLYATNDNDLDLTSLKLTIQFKFNNCLCKLSGNVTDKMILQDIFMLKLPTYVNYLRDEKCDLETFKKIMNSINYTLRRKIDIPTYLNTLEEYIYWFDKLKHKKFPTNINSRDKFEEYNNTLEQLNLDNGLDNLKNSGIIPEWVSNKDTAEKCILVDFSTTSKKWKTSQQALLQQHRVIQRPIYTYATSYSYDGMYDVIN